MSDDTYDSFDLRKPRRQKRVSAITGKPTALNPETELQIQLICAYDARCRLDRYLRLGTTLFAVGANAGKRPLHQAVLAKRMGERKGTWDMVLVDWRRDRHRVHFIEVKAPDGRLTTEQKELRDKMAGSTVEFSVVKTLDEFLEIIK